MASSDNNPFCTNLAGRFLGESAGQRLRGSFAGLWGLGHGEAAWIPVRTISVFRHAVKEFE